MAAITDLSDLVNRMTGGNSGSPENIFFFKLPYIAGTVDTWTQGAMYSTWTYDGFPAPASAPGAVAAPTKATAGAIPFTNPGGGREKWLPQAIAVPQTNGDIAAILLYDRLLHISGLSGTTTTPQTVGGTLTRNTGGVGNMIFYEIYSAVGSTNGRTITASYTDQDGNSGVTSGAQVFGGSDGKYNDDRVMVPIPLAAGDTGVQAVASVTVSATTGGAGNFGITIARPLALLVAGGRGGLGLDMTVGPTGIPEIDTDACLATAIQVSTTTEVGFFAMLSTVEA